jgi:hypothetical protein
MADEKFGNTLPGCDKGFMIAPSPFNAVKLDVGVILVVGFLLLLVQGHITTDITLQFLLLLGFGSGGMGWIVLRTRRVMARVLASRKHAQDGPH